MLSQPIHQYTPEQIYEALETSPEGLSEIDASARLSLYGENILSEHRKEPILNKLAVHFFHPLAGVLTVAGFLALTQNEADLAVVIWFITFANAGFSFWREYRAEKAVEKLQEILPSYAHIIRNGVDVHIPARQVVPGDVLVLAEGDNIPADARVIEEYGLRSNNATLTGESVPVRKIADPCENSAVSELEQPNLIFAGTSVAAGTGRAVVYATGMLTQFGRIARLTQTVEEPLSPLQQEIRQLINRITWIVLALGAVVILVGITEMKMAWQEVSLLALGIIVAAIPEGLPATLTLSLAMAVQRLAQKGVLAKKLTILETLGNVSVICTDKSGTLTQNQMTVRDVWVAGQFVQVGGAGYEPKGEFRPAPENTLWEEDFLTLMDAASCCNNSRLNPPGRESPLWSGLGDQTEVALKVAALKAGISEKALTMIYPRVHEIPFDARRKRMTTIHRETSAEIAFVKGAPREILQLCTRIQYYNEIIPLTPELRAEILAANDRYARQALRVLAVARRTLTHKAGPYTSEIIERDLIFIGLVGMMDPPRPEVENAIRTCRQAQIRIVMITGDYGLTAESLARRIGMLTSPNPRIITGSELDEMSEMELEKSLESEVLFARMAPEHKMRLVAAFQQRGEVVAVTGDGVNDAPALRKADVGIAMGVIGTDVAKEAADVILTNDNFGAIISAIEEGRAVFDNIRKVMTYIFSSNVPEIMPFILAGAIRNFPLALNVEQILAIDLGTDIFPALALSAEKPEPDVMQRPPRKRGQPIIDNALLARAFLWLGMIETILCFTGFLSVYLLSGNASLIPIPGFEQLKYPDWLALHVSPMSIATLAVTVFHAGVVMAQIGNAYACRSETERGHKLGWVSNRGLLLGIAIEVLVILAIIYEPTLSEMFNHDSIPWQYWLGLPWFALIIYALEWIRKQIARYQHQPKTV